MKIRMLSVGKLYKKHLESSKNSQRFNEPINKLKLTVERTIEELTVIY